LPNYIPFGKDLLSLGSVKKKRQILFLGRIHPIKNLEFLIDVLAHSDLEGVKLLIAGTGKQDYINSLKELVKKYRLDCVEFAGHLEGDQKNKALETSMCLVLPSRSENFGNVVIEALAMGTTVITSNKTPWSILEEKDVGWYLPLEREQWVRVLQDYFIHANSEMINSQSKKAKKLVFEKFSTDVGAEKWLEVLNSLRK
jgi:glycosyltransferase involved in cell wall biosynthesis